MTAVALVSITSCEKKEATEATEAQTEATASEDAQAYKVNTADSKVTWRGYAINEKENSEHGHEGFMKLESGTISVEGDKVVAGDFVIDAASLESTDLNDEPEDKERLDSHLKSEDFLAVDKYPTASFAITAVKPLEGEYNSEISGNFKMRDIEKNISFKANITHEGHVLKIDSEEFTINRQDFGITFKGGKGSLIRDNVTLQVNVAADHQM